MNRFEILQGDVHELIKTIETGSVGAIICDPPYATTQCAWDQPLKWDVLWPELWRVCASPSAPIVLFSAQPFTTDLINSQRSFWRYETIWEKPTGTGFLDANRRPLRCHENLQVFSQKGSGTYNPQKTAGVANHASHTRKASPANLYGAVQERSVNREDGMKFPRSVVKHGKHSSAETSHPSQKPLSLMTYLVLTYSNEGDAILDFTCGSGTTGEACLLHDRRFIGIERDPHYFEIARQRLEATTGKFSPREFGGLFAEVN